MTARDLTPSVLSAIQGDAVQLALFFEGEFNTGTVRLWTGIGSIDWNGQTWAGAGNLIGVATVEETDRIVANGITVSLSGVDTANISLAIDEARQGLKGRIWLAVMSDPATVLADPYQFFVGRLDVPTIADGGETCTISISYESRLIDVQRPRNRRYTDEDQKIDYPSDRGLEYVAAIQQQEVTWGRRG